MNNRNPIGEQYYSVIRRMAELVSKRPPSIDWMILTLSGLDLYHKIFGRNYVPSLKEREKKKEDGVYVSNFDGFFSGLPHINSKARRIIMILDPTQKKRLKLS